jgi:antitoxin ParD1/3/4
MDRRAGCGYAGRCIPMQEGSIMEIRLPAELEAFVQELIASGMYEHPDMIVHDALWLLKDQVALYKVKQEELRKLIAVGIEQLDRGQVAPLDMEAIMAKAAVRLQQIKEQEANECPK